MWLKSTLNLSSARTTYTTWRTVSVALWSLSTSALTGSAIQREARRITSSVSVAE